MNEMVNRFSTSIVSGILGVHRIQGQAVVDKHSFVTDEAVAKDYAVVIKSRLADYVKVSDNAIVDNCELYDHAWVYGNAKVVDIIVKDNSRVFGNAVLNSSSTGSRVSLKGDCKFGGHATFDGLNTQDDFVRKYGANKVQVIASKYRVTLVDVWDMG